MKQRSDNSQYAPHASAQRGKQQTARQGLGKTGERLAAEHLTSLGYCILEKNFRCSYGEIDLVAEHGQDLVFVEVKTRRGYGYGLPEEAITWQKKRKLVQVATYYLDQHHGSERAWRIDVVAVQLDSSGRLEEIRVLDYAVAQE